MSCFLSSWVVHNASHYGEHLKNQSFDYKCKGSIASTSTNMYVRLGQMWSFSWPYTCTECKIVNIFRYSYSLGQILTSANIKHLTFKNCFKRYIYIYIRFLGGLDCLFALLNTYIAKHTGKRNHSQNLNYLKHQQFLFTWYLVPVSATNISKDLQNGGV